MSLPPPPNADHPLTRSELVRAALFILATLVALQFLWSARLLVLTVFLGLLFGLAASSAVTWLCRRVPIRRAIAAPLVVFGAVAMLVGVGIWSGPTLAKQSRELRTKLPQALSNVENWFAEKQPWLLNAVAPLDTTVSDTAVVAGGREVSRGAPAGAGTPQAGTAADSVPGSGRLTRAVTTHTSQLSQMAFGVLQSTFAVGAGIVLLIFTALYIAIDPDVYRRGTLLLLSDRLRPRFDRLFTVLGDSLRTWFATQLIAMLVIGSITTIALAIIGVRAAVPLGVIAGLFEFVPNIGPVLASIPAILMGFVDSPQKALIVTVTYIGIQFLENNLLIPYLMREQLDLPPALTLITQVLMAYIFGFLGLFVAIPLLATAVVSVRMLWIGEEITLDGDRETAT